MSNASYVKDIEQENEKLRKQYEDIATQLDEKQQELDTMSHHYNQGEVKLVSVLVGSKTNGFVSFPIFAHPIQRECVKFINTHHKQYWSEPLLKREMAKMLGIKRVTILYQLTFICGARNKKVKDRFWYYGFKSLEKKGEAQIYDPKKKAFMVGYDPNRSI